MKFANDKKGAALIFTFIIIIALLILGAVIISRSIWESHLTQRYTENIQALWLAEAGLNQALQALRTSYNSTAVAGTQLGRGGYSAEILHNEDGSRTITAHGFIPYSPPYRRERIIQVVMNKYASVPPGFYDHVIYSAGGVELKGIWEGDIEYANDLPLLDFDQLRAISKAQTSPGNPEGNYHDASHLDGPFPTSFWYNAEAKIPNVVFLEGSLNVSGQKQVLGGFYVVGGEFIYDATIGGNASIDGAVYTRGNFTIHGGGGVPFNVKGGIWSGKKTTLGGSSIVKYWGEYMAAIRDLGINTDVQVIPDSWKDKQNPYILVP